MAGQSHVTQLDPAFTRQLSILYFVRLIVRYDLIENRNSMFAVKHHCADLVRSACWS